MLPSPLRGKVRSDSGPVQTRDKVGEESDSRVSNMAALTCIPLFAPIGGLLIFNQPNLEVSASDRNADTRI